MSLSTVGSFQSERIDVEFPSQLLPPGTTSADEAFAVVFLEGAAKSCNEQPSPIATKE